jgi:arginase family enzyme
LRFAETDLLEGLDPKPLLDLACRGGRAFVSIDIDGVDQNAAPGVSAPAPLGLAVRDALRLAEAAGIRKQVVHFDLMEFNPSHDVDGRTARLLCLLFLQFLAGLSRRKT